MKSDEGIEFRSDGAWLDLRLNRPGARNALSLAMLDALNARLDQAADLPHAVLQLSGAGPVFCAGFDLEEAVATPGTLGAMIRRLGTICRRLRTLPQVVVAQVQGAALAGGCALVSACDFVIADPEATFGYPVHAIGVSPAVTLPTLTASLGHDRARSLTLSGRIVSALEAQRLGLVSHIAEAPGDEALQTLTRTVLESLAAKGPHALRTTRAWLTELEDLAAHPGAEGAAEDSAQAAEKPQARALLREFWDARRRRAEPGR